MSEQACRFCLHNQLLSDAPIFETERFYVLRSNDPALPHSTMVIPRRHGTTPLEMDAAEWVELPMAIEGARQALGSWAPDGYTIGWNVGAVAGQTVDHTHLHVIARFKDEPMAGKGIRHPLKKALRQDHNA
ncbi:HIT family protein [Devosia sp. XJ19-1]|uniref:HIT family protein n=1 Tax=Devosia ureilytica TaxID=2952754 RepID=A0A9Q4ANS3_9HYPH|nr:HIT family protein [Devosia ureilytica]MCP8883467.1 HIT family protein [Devosia ureilytica]MCP8887075.1 HIT family protein [Devosia ureilytica]